MTIRCKVYQHASFNAMAGLGGVPVAPRAPVPPAPPVVGGGGLGKTQGYRQISCRPIFGSVTGPWGKQLIHHCNAQWQHWPIYHADKHQDGQHECYVVRAYRHKTIDPHVRCWNRTVHISCRCSHYLYGVHPSQGDTLHTTICNSSFTTKLSDLPPTRSDGSLYGQNKTKPTIPC
jgi:hypothetical protein